MTEPTSIELRELTGEFEYEQLVGCYPPAVDNGLLKAARDMVDLHKAAARRRFLLSWQGSKVPRGVVLPTGVIAWTQHGVVRSKGGEQIGTYDRIQQWGGESGNEHKLIVSLP